MQAEPQKEHQWLMKLLGDWTVEGEASMGPDQPPTKWEGTESVRAIGDVWIQAEAEGTMPGGGPTTTLMTLGYDPDKKKFVGTFLGSMMTNLWVYEGQIDAAGSSLILDTEGPGMAGDGTMAKYRDTIEFKSNDHRILSSQVLGADGNWTRFMTTHYRRKT